MAGASSALNSGADVNRALSGKGRETQPPPMRWEAAVSGTVEPGAALADEPRLLAPLRQDVGLYPGPHDAYGAPSQVLHDPAADGYYHIGPIEFEMLARWDLRQPDLIAAQITQDTTFTATLKDVEDFAEQLRRGGLLRVSARELLAQKETQAKTQPHALNRAVNEILFKRIPLVRPQRSLDATAFLVAPFFARSFWLVLAALFVVALYLVGRQWDLFVASLFNMASLSGAVTISIALVISKSMHELAHGYATRRYGADVPVMGLAFILFWPLLYTETSHAWTLPQRRQRIVIASAGVAAELALAAACFIAWPFLEPGALRDAAGFTATTLIVLSLAFNANPLMKFDGYFVLSELAGIENMQPRGFELLKWQLRKWIAGVTLPYPETVLSGAERRMVLGYGIASAIYRIFLYGGIVYALNLMLFPATALPLSVLIIMSSLVKPVFSEFVMWLRLAWRARGVVGLVRIMVICAIVASPLFIPWRSSVQISVVAGTGDIHDLFANEPARIMQIYVTQGQNIAAGAVVMRLSSPNLEFELGQARAKAASLDKVINRQLTGLAYHQDVNVSENELARLRSQIRGLRARQDKLIVRAPVSGRVATLERVLRPGIWVGVGRSLAQIVASSAPVLKGYGEERDIGLVEPGARAHIVLDGRPGSSLAGSVAAIYPKAIIVLDEPILAVPAGGPIDVRPYQNTLVPMRAIYKVKLVLDSEDQTKLPPLQTRGFAIIETAPRNLIGRISERVIGLWRRELG